MAKKPAACESYGVSAVPGDFHREESPDVTHLLGIDPHQFIADYGAWAVLLIVGLESMGLPLPGETILVAASIYAGTTGRLDITHVIFGAAVGAFVGDNLGYWIGRRFGFPLLLRHGPRIGLDERRLKLGRYLFQHYGGAVVFFGRFVALLRTLAALLAGVNEMPWSRFLVFNLLGGVVWASVFGLGGFVLGEAVQRVAGPAGSVALVLGVAAAVAGVAAVKRAEAKLLAKAEAAFPGSLAPRDDPLRFL